MLLRLLLLFTVVPLVELVLLLELAAKISWPFTLVLILTTGVVGAALARHEGIRCLKRIQQQMAAGQLPADPLIDGLMILVAGAVLVTPGILTDLVGFALLLPIFRRLVKRWLKGRFEARIRAVSSAHGWPPRTDHPAGRDKIIDARVLDAQSKDPDEDT